MMIMLLKIIGMGVAAIIGFYVLKAVLFLAAIFITFLFKNFAGISAVLLIGYAIVGGLFNDNINLCIGSSFFALCLFGVQSGINKAFPEKTIPRPVYYDPALHIEETVPHSPGKTTSIFDMGQPQHEKSRCGQCNSSGYGPGCPFSSVKSKGGTKGIHVHTYDGNCVFCGSPYTGPGCPWSPSGYHKKIP